MTTPFEDLEFLADYLPEEGEAVIVARRDGELVCEPFRAERARDGMIDTEFYGRLVHCNERLNQTRTMPFALGAMLAFALCVGYHEISQVGWRGWYVDVALIAGVILGGMLWSATRQRVLFKSAVEPVLEAQLRNRGLAKFALLGGIRQHPELRSLCRALTRWTE